MSYKTILVHLSNDRAHMARLNVAISLARRYEAHLVVLYVATPISMPAEVAGRAASIAFIQEATEVAKEEAERIRTEIEASCRSQKLSWEWRMAEGDHLDLLAANAHYADLAVVTHSRAELLEDRVVFHVPEHLPLVAACPVIVLPAEGEPKPIEDHALIAWKECREAARAVASAIPALKRAKEVTVLSLLPPGGTDVSGAKLVEYLARHGVKAKAVSDHCSHGDTGDAILTHVATHHATLLVMGAYGHSRLQEMILGGVTRDVLNNLPVPVLLSH